MKRSTFDNVGIFGRCKNNTVEIVKGVGKKISDVVVGGSNLTYNVITFLPNILFGFGKSNKTLDSGNENIGVVFPESKGSQKSVGELMTDLVDGQNLKEMKNIELGILKVKDNGQDDKEKKETEDNKQVYKDTKTEVIEVSVKSPTNERKRKKVDVETFEVISSRELVPRMEENNGKKEIKESKYVKESKEKVQTKRKESKPKPPAITHKIRVPIDEKDVPSSIELELRESIAYLKVKKIEELIKARRDKKKSLQESALGKDQLKQRKYFGSQPLVESTNNSIGGVVDSNTGKKLEEINVNHFDNPIKTATVQEKKRVRNKLPIQTSFGGGNNGNGKEERDDIDVSPILSNNDTFSIRKSIQRKGPKTIQLHRISRETESPSKLRFKKSSISLPKPGLESNKKSLNKQTSVLHPNHQKNRSNDINIINSTSSSDKLKTSNKVGVAQPFSQTTPSNKNVHFPLGSTKFILDDFSFFKRSSEIQNNNFGNVPFLHTPQDDGRQDNFGNFVSGKKLDTDKKLNIEKGSIPPPITKQPSYELEKETDRNRHCPYVVLPDGKRVNKKDRFHYESEHLPSTISKLNIVGSSSDIELSDDCVCNLKFDSFVEKDDKGEDA